MSFDCTLPSSLLQGVGNEELYTQTIKSAFSEQMSQVGLAAGEVPRWQPFSIRAPGEPDVLVSKHPARQFPLLALWPLRISRSCIGFKRFPCHPWPYDWLSQSSWQVVTPATTTVTPSP